MFKLVFARTGKNSRRDDRRRRIIEEKRAGNLSRFYPPLRNVWCILELRKSLSFHLSRIGIIKDESRRQLSVPNPLCAGKLCKAASVQ